MSVENAYADKELCEPLLAAIEQVIGSMPAPLLPLRIMEVCGTHTMSIFRHGIRSLLPQGIQLLSGPGCPVCVTPAAHIDLCLAAAKKERVILASFGDLLRVPGSDGSLADARAAGCRVEIVYSPMDSLVLAQQNKDHEVVFPAIGFETTMPTIAATLLIAEKEQCHNFSVIALGKTMPAALDLLFQDEALQVDALLCPGHVSAIIGAAAYHPLVNEYNLACAVAGFEPADILAGLLSLARQRLEGKARVDNCYPRAVSTEGNRRAQALIAEAFSPADSLWRGLGNIKGSGLRLKEKYAAFDAVKKLALQVAEAKEPKGCKCGQILKGIMSPPACPLYGKKCTPLHPIGPCMVSTEGTCAAYFRYGGDERALPAQ